MDNNTVELTERLLQNQPDPKEDRLERIFTALGAKPIDQCGTTEHPLDRVFPGINIHSLDDNEKYSAPIRTTTQKQQSNQEDLYSLDEINAAIKAASNGTTRLPQCENNIGANNLNPPSLEALQRIRDHFKT